MGSKLLTASGSVSDFGDTASEAERIYCRATALSKTIGGKIPLILQG
jgi:hypothetical protein